MFLLSVGNDNIHMLTSGKRQRLRFDLEDWEGNTSYAEYDNFRVDSEHENYRLSSIGSYTGTAGWYGMKNVYCFSRLRAHSPSRKHLWRAYDFLRHKPAFCSFRLQPGVCAGPDQGFEGPYGPNILRGSITHTILECACESAYLRQANF